MYVPEVAVVDEPQYLHVLACFTVPLLWQRFCLLSGWMFEVKVTVVMRKELDVIDGEV